MLAENLAVNGSWLEFWWPTWSRVGRSRPLDFSFSIPDASVSSASSHFVPHGDTCLWSVDILGFIFRLLMQICVTFCRKRKSSWRKRILSKKKLWRMKKLWTPELKSFSKFSFTSTLCLSFMLLSLHGYLKMHTHTHTHLEYWCISNHVSLDQVCTFYKDCCATWRGHTHTHTHTLLWWVWLFTFWKNLFSYNDDHQTRRCWFQSEFYSSVATSAVFAQHWLEVLFLYVISSAPIGNFTCLIVTDPY